MRSFPLLQAFAPCPLRTAIAAAATTTGLGIALGEARRLDEAIQAHQWDIAICEHLVRGGCGRRSWASWGTRLAAAGSTPDFNRLNPRANT